MTNIKNKPSDNRNNYLKKGVIPLPPRITENERKEMYIRLNNGTLESSKKMVVKENDK